MSCSPNSSVIRAEALRAASREESGPEQVELEDGGLAEEALG